jgi:O-antigen ligase
VLLVLFAFMGPYSLHRTSAEAQQGTAALQTAAAQSGGGVEEGAKTRRVAILALGLFSALTLSRLRRRRNTQGVGAGGRWEAVAVSPTGDTRYNSPVVWRAAQSLTGAPAQRTALAWLLAAYFLVAAASVAWALDPAFTARRLIAFLVIAFAAFVLGQAWSLRDVVYFALLANLMPLLLGFVLSVGRGDFHPLDPTYRFTGLAHPNVHGLEGACLAMAAYFALRLGGGRRVMLAGILVFALVLLYLTKSRTAVGAVVLAAGVCMMVSVPRRRLFLLGMAVAAVAGSVLIFVPDVAGRAQEAALLQRSAKSDDPATLSGRTLLWADLMAYSAEKPALGYGFDSFWTADHIAEVSLRRGWVIIQAHSGYIQELLDTGILGLSILVLILMVALRAAFVRFRKTRSPLALYALAMFVWYVATLVPEAVDLSHVSTFIVMILLAHFALRNAGQDDDVPEPAQLVRATY